MLNTPSVPMSTGGGCVLGSTVSRLRRALADTILPCACILSVIYRQASIVRRCHAPFASGLFSGQSPPSDRRERAVWPIRRLDADRVAGPGRAAGEDDPHDPGLSDEVAAFVAPERRGHQSPL